MATAFIGLQHGAGSPASDAICLVAKQCSGHCCQILSAAQSATPFSGHEQTEHLFALIDAFRRHRRAVTAADLAQEMDVSVRTIYRDVQTLIGLGAPSMARPARHIFTRPGADT